MRQFILPEDWDGSLRCVIEGGRARYLSRVLRLEPGDVFPAMDRTGRRWRCEIKEGGPERLVLAVDPLPAGIGTDHLPDARRRQRGAVGRPELVGTQSEAAPLAASPRIPITLIQGLPKGVKMDIIVRQAAEAGLTGVIPLVSRRSVAKAGAAARRARWERIAREALQQSGSPVVTRVRAPVELEGLQAALGSCKGRRLSLLLHELPLAQVSLHGYLTETPDEIVLCVGPEGGFDEDETAFLMGAGFKPLRLAGAILRTETAALYAVAAVETILSERSSWIPKPP